MRIERLLISTAAVLIGVPVCAAQTPVAPATSDEGQNSSARESTGLDEIIVTAQRKSERLQDVPISVNVVSGSQLAARGGLSSIDLPSLVPALQFTRAGGGGTPFLRGVGTTNGDVNIEPSVATYIDGVYIANNYANISSLVNVERIEVLKGPQGTLFGRNATGGVIQVITKDPSEISSMDMSVGYASYDTVFGSIYATGGITDHLSGNLAIQGSSQSKGWGRNVVTGAESYKSKDVSVRGKLLWEPSDQFTARLAADYQYLRSGIGDYRLPKGELGFDGVAFPDDRYDTRGTLLLNGGGEPYVRTEQLGTSLHLDYKTDIGTFVSISAYRKTYGLAAFDPDMTPIPLQEVAFPQRQHNISQELQFISPTDWPVSVTAGLYYFKNSAGYKNALVSGLALDPNFSQIVTLGFTAVQRSESVAGYVQADANILPKTKLTMGIRYTHERDSFSMNFAGINLPAPRIGYDKPTWRVAIDHAINPDVHLYASYNRGIKAGGYDLVDFSGTGTGFAPERLDAYEAGLKTELFDRKLRFNAAYFYYDYQNIQLSVVPGGQGTVALARTINAAKARIQGFDTDFAFAPVRNLTINGGFAYVDGKYLRFTDPVPSFPISPFDPALPPSFPNGMPTVRTPKYSGNLGITYAIDTDSGRFGLTGSASYSGAYSFSPDRSSRQDDYVMVNASINWTSADEKYGVSAFVRNLTDAAYFSTAVPSSFGQISAYGPPRTFGVSMRVRFGG